MATFGSQQFKKPVLNVQAKSTIMDTRFYEFMKEAYEDYLQDSSIWGLILVTKNLSFLYNFIYNSYKYT